MPEIELKLFGNAKIIPKQIKAATSRFGNREKLSLNYSSSSDYPG